MKLMHLSDLHIGKRVNEFSMIEDQQYILKQILDIARTEHISGILLAGDVYDKPIPPAEAVQVLNDFLTELSEWGIKVFLISGNHDSAQRLSFGAQLMQSAGVYVSSVFEKEVQSVTLQDEYGKVTIHLLPYLNPSIVRHSFEEETIETYQDAVRVVLEHMQVDTKKRNVLVAHQFVTGAGRCESEEILVGGLDNVDASLFDAFDYVALGHIHSPQYIGRKTLRYCGTPLKYSFSEAEQEKSVTIVELGAKGEILIHTVPLTPLRDMRKLRGSYMELTARSYYQDMNVEDYFQITLTDEEDILDGVQKLRTIYPNLMRLTYDNTRTRENRAITVEERERTEIEAFEEFYELQNNQPMSEQQKDYVQGLIQKLQSS